MNTAQSQNAGIISERVEKLHQRMEAPLPDYQPNQINKRTVIQFKENKKRRTSRSRSKERSSSKLEPKSDRKGKDHMGSRMLKTDLLDHFGKKSGNSNGGKKIKLNESLTIVDEKNSSSNSQINLAKNIQKTKLTDFAGNFIIGSVSKSGGQSSMIATENAKSRIKLKTINKGTTNVNSEMENIDKIEQQKIALEELKVKVKNLEDELKKKDMELNNEKVLKQVNFLFKKDHTGKVKKELMRLVLAVEERDRVRKEELHYHKKVRLGRHLPQGTSKIKRKGQVAKNEIWVDGFEIREFKDQLNSFLEERSNLEELRKKLKGSKRLMALEAKVDPEILEKYFPDFEELKKQSRKEEELIKEFKDRVKTRLDILTRVNFYFKKLENQTTEKIEKIHKERTMIAFETKKMREEL